MSDKIELLILEVEKHLNLYDRTRQDYKNAEKKIDVWTIIGRKEGMRLMWFSIKASSRSHSSELILKY